MAYSKEFRGEVLSACDAGEGTQSVALRFDVSEAWVRRIKQQRRETGQVAAKTTRHRKPIWQNWADWLLAKIDERPDIYLRELQGDATRNGTVRYDPHEAAQDRCRGHRHRP